MENLSQKIIAQAQKAKTAARVLRTLSTDKKNAALRAIAAGLLRRMPEILAANAKDVEGLLKNNPDVNKAIKGRLVLTEQKILAIAQGVLDIVNLPDPVGEVVKMTRRPNGLRVGKIRIPIGVICCIYESRPNVTVDIAALSLKSGNACILRGGKESLNSNIILSEIITEAVASAGIPADFLQMITTTDHAAITELAKCDQYIDLIIPRGGEKLIDAVCANAKMPVMRHRKGVAHLYVAKTADLSSAIKIIHNAKVSNPSTCNSLEKALIDKSVAAAIVPDLVKKLVASGVEVRGCEKIKALSADVKLAQDEDWSKEYLDYIITLKVVNGFDEAVFHINQYSTGLSDGIITQDYAESWKFLTAVDSAATYVNASTRFTDGSEFGLGAEIGINTSKIHGMGPMGLEELTVTKYIVLGDGQIRE